MPPRTLVVSLAVACLALGCVVVTAGCTGQEPPPEQLPSEMQPFQIAEVIPTETTVPTTEAEATRMARATRAAVAGGGTEPAPAAGTPGVPEVAAVMALPADPEAVVVQWARIDPDPWEPEILADMVPDLSLQAGGFGVFHYAYAGGPSQSGWYQTIVTPTLILDFARLLLEDLDLAGLADRHEATTPRFATGVDGRPAGTGPVHVIYVQTTLGENRLVIADKTLRATAATDPDFDRLQRLREVLDWIEVWQSGAERNLDPAYQVLGADRMGWWSEWRLPYAPTSAIAYGTLARTGIPSDAQVATWPSARRLADLVTARLGGRPDELRAGGGDLAALLAAATVRDLQRTALGQYNADLWGPLWADGTAARYVVGIRPTVPGGNHVVIDYTYELPKRGLGLLEPLVPAVPVVPAVPAASVPSVPSVP